MKWILSIIFVSLIGWYVYANIETFRFILSIKLNLLIPIAFLMFLTVCLNSLHFYLQLSSISHGLPLFPVVKYFVIGQFLPHGGQIYQAAVMKKEYHLNYKTFVSVLVSFRWIKLLFVLLFSTTIIALSDPGLSIEGVPAIVFALGVVVFQIGSIPLIKRLNRYIQGMDVSNRGVQWLQTLSRMIDDIFKPFNDPWLALQIIFIVFLGECLGVATHFLLFKSLGAAPGIAQIAIYNGVLKISAITTITPSNIGVREFLFGYLSLGLGAVPALGITVSLIYRMVFFLVKGALCILLIPINRKVVSP